MFKNGFAVVALILFILLVRWLVKRSPCSSYVGTEGITEVVKKSWGRLGTTTLLFRDVHKLQLVEVELVGQNQRDIACNFQRDGKTIYSVGGRLYLDTSEPDPDRVRPLIAAARQAYERFRQNRWAA